MAASPTLDVAPEIRSTPTRVGERLHVYDLIRGTAILGILLANISYFAGPGFGDFATLPPGSSASDLTIAAWTTALVSGKFRTMLAILFGIGMWLQFEKSQEQGKKWPRAYFRRMSILALIGLAHWLLIWPGDILLTYSVTAILCSFWVGRSDRFQRGFVWTSGALCAAIALGGLAAAALGEHDDLAPNPGAITAQTERDVFGAGTYGEQLQLRARVLAHDGPEMLIYVPLLAGIFFFGIQLGRFRVLERIHNVAKARRIMLGLGLGVGLPASALCGALLAPNNEIFTAVPVELFFGPLFGVGLIAGLAIWAHSDVLAGLQRALARVGRVAMSCYILQSVVCTAIFYSWGLGWYGRLDRLQMLAVVPLVWAIDLAFAYFWLQKFRIGPLEWLWRSTAEGRWLQIRTD